FGGAQRRSQRLGGFGHRQAREVAELYQLGCLWVGRFQAVEGIVQGQQVIGRGRRDQQSLIEIDALPTAAVPRPALATGAFDQDAAHGFRRGGEKVAATTPRRR